MKPQLASWNHVLSFTLHILVCQAAWVRKFQCGSSPSIAQSDSSFRIDSLRGNLDTFDRWTVLSLSILAVHDKTEFACNNLNLTALETDLRFHVLGYPVGHVEHFRSQCPLPTTAALTP